MGGAGYDGHVIVSATFAGTACGDVFPNIEGSGTTVPLSLEVQRDGKILKVRWSGSLEDAMLESSGKLGPGAACVPVPMFGAWA
jgi:hypothetical protein